MDLSKVEFKGEKRYLSNMYPCKVIFDSESDFYNDFKDIFVFDNEVYHSSEHLYQALKSKDPRWHEFLRGIDKPEKTKTAARKMLQLQPTLFDGEFSFVMRKDWEEVKLKAMELVLLLKFSQNKDLLVKLKKESLPIVERNCWGDTFWGVVDGKGFNHLGRILEKVRDIL